MQNKLSTTRAVGRPPRNAPARSINLNIPEPLLREIDAARGRKSRTVFLLEGAFRQISDADHRAATNLREFLTSA